MNFKTRSFFERLTGSVPSDEFDKELADETHIQQTPKMHAASEQTFLQEEEAQLTVDVFQTADEIILQAMVAGVRTEDLDVSISQDMVSISGKRSRAHTATDDNFYYKELYWGGFSRSILLPQEVDAEEAQATIKNGLLTIRLPKLDKTKIQKLRIKTE